MLRLKTVNLQFWAQKRVFWRLCLFFLSLGCFFAICVFDGLLFRLIEGGHIGGSSLRCFLFWRSYGFEMMLPVVFAVLMLVFRANCLYNCRWGDFM